MLDLFAEEADDSYKPTISETELSDDELLLSSKILGLLF